MNFRTLGKTGISASVLSFGAAPLGNMYGPRSVEDCHEAVALALENGINFFDTAPYYGNGLSEEMLGKCLKAHGAPRHQYSIATKVGRYGPSDFDYSASRLTDSIDKSLALLQTDYVDFIQCHDIEFVDIDQVIHEAIPVLRKAVEKGKARFITVTGLQISALRAAYTATEVDGILSYSRFTLANTDLDTVIPELNEREMAIIYAAPLSMGLLADAAPPAWHPAWPELRAAARQAADFCRTQGVDLADLAMQFSLSNPNLHTVLVGMGDAETVRRNLPNVGKTPDPVLIDTVRAFFAPFAGKIWPTGRPENQDSGVHTADTTDAKPEESK